VWLIVATVIAATAGGVWAERRYGTRAGTGTRRALMIVLYFVLPPATFFNIADAELDANVGIGVLIAYLALAAAVAIAWLASTRLLGLSRSTVGAVLCCTVVANTGYLGYPLCASLLGLDSLSEAAVYDVLVSAPSLLLVAFSIGAAFGTRAGEGAGERTRAFLTRNPALYAGIAGLIAPEALAPDVLVDISRIAIVAILPLGFFAVGVALAEESEEGALAVPPRFDSAVAVALASRLVLAPGLLFALALPLIDLPDPYLLLAAMPCGINSLIVAHAYGLDVRVTASAIAWSTAIVIVIAAAAPLLV
jgi:predicted permease